MSDACCQSVEGGGYFEGVAEVSHAVRGEQDSPVVVARRVELAVLLPHGDRPMPDIDGLRQLHVGEVQMRARVEQFHGQPRLMDAGANILGLFKQFDR